MIDKNLFQYFDAKIEHIKPDINEIEFDIKNYSIFENNRESGHPAIYVKNNKPFLISDFGTFDLLDNSKISDMKIKSIGHRHNLECIHYVDGEFYKSMRECHGDENPLKTAFENSKINYKNLKYDKSTGKYYYLDNNKLYEWNGTKFVNSKITKEYFDKLPHNLEYNINVKKILDLKYKKPTKQVIPSQHTLTLFFKNKMDYIDKFGCQIVYKDNLPFYKFNNKTNKWDQICYMSQMYSGLYEKQPSFDLYHTISVNDTSTCLVFFNNKYFYYNRCNLGAGCRYIQVSTSEDLINWSKYKLIDIPEFQFRINQDNFYIPSFFVYGNKIIGILSYMDIKNHILEIKLYYSYNGIKFIFSHNLYECCLKIQKNEKKDLHNYINNILISPGSLYYGSFVNSELKNENNNNKINYIGFIHSEVKNGKKLFNLSQKGFIKITGNKIKTKKVFYNVNDKLLEFSGLIDLVVYNKDHKKIFEGKINNDNILQEFNEINKSGEYYFEITLINDVNNYTEIYNLNIANCKQQSQKYNAIEYYYAEHTNYVISRLRDNVDNNGYRYYILPENEYYTELIGEPFYENDMTIVKQKILTENGEIITVTLEDNSNKNESEIYRLRFLKNPYIKKGTSCCIFLTRPVVYF